MTNRTRRRTLFLFHRDLRLDDNTALIEALQSGDEVVPCVVVESERGIRAGDGGAHAARFTLESLEDLDTELKREGAFLHVYRGDAARTVSRLVQEQDVDAVYFNRDYTPAGRDWEAKVTRAAGKAGAMTGSWDDSLLHGPGRVLKDDGSPYTVFTPYYRRAVQQPVREPRSAGTGRWASLEGAEMVEELRRAWNPGERTKVTVPGGRRAALEILQALGRFSGYRDERDLPSVAGTTSLSPYLRSGCCSAREVLRAIRDRLGAGHELVRQLHWRDFFTQIAFHYPHVFDGAFHRHYDTLAWDEDEKRFEAWKHGRTGIPIVDAGMRELASTGQMHNRVRMIVASVLVKDLHIDWRRGERHFAETLVDYDPAVNNGNWQWAASTGCDAQPYFRIFNPWLQQKKFDAAAVYIKRWVDELSGVQPADIHNLWKTRPAGLETYPRPLVDHGREARIARERFQRTRQSRA